MAHLLLLSGSKVYMSRLQLEILSYLTDGKFSPLTAQDLVKLIRSRVNGPKFWFLEPRIYPALRELEYADILSSYYADASAPRGWRPRRYYRLTVRGADVARALGV